MLYYYTNQIVKYTLYIITYIARPYVISIVIIIISSSGSSGSRGSSGSSMTFALFLNVCMGRGVMGCL